MEIKTVYFCQQFSMIMNLDEIANELNTYFVNIERSLNDQIQAVTTGNDYLLQHNKTGTTFNFVSVNEVYIDDVINKLKNKSSYGYDTISNKHIKYARNVLTKPSFFLKKRKILLENQQKLPYLQNIYIYVHPTTSCIYKHYT